MAYTARIVNETTYRNDVRSKLGLSSSRLPDEYISSDTHLMNAETWIISMVSDWEIIKQQAGDDSAKLYAATIYAVCAEICDAIPQILPSLERDMDSEMRYIQVDWAKKEQEFREKAVEKIGQISTYISISSDILWTANPT